MGPDVMIFVHGPGRKRRMYNRRSFSTALLLVSFVLFFYTGSSQAVDMARYWNGATVHLREFKELAGQPYYPAEPAYAISRVRSYGYSEHRDGIDWYKYQWTFPDRTNGTVIVRTAMGIDSSFIYDGFDKYYYPKNTPVQKFVPYKLLGTRYPNVNDQTETSGDLKYYVSSPWGDWREGAKYGTYFSLWTCTRMWSGSVTYDFRGSSRSKTWTGSFVELTEDEWHYDLDQKTTGHWFNLYTLMEDTGLIGLTSKDPATGAVIANFGAYH
jgi:hypothetical protein